MGDYILGSVGSVGELIGAVWSPGVGITGSAGISVDGFNAVQALVDGLFHN